MKKQLNIKANTKIETVIAEIAINDTTTLSFNIVYNLNYQQIHPVVTFTDNSASVTVYVYTPDNLETVIEKLQNTATVDGFNQFGFFEKII